MKNKKHERYAPEGATWVCGACGRSGKDRYALGDTSCVTWAVLVKDESIQRDASGRVIKAEAYEEGSAALASMASDGWAPAKVQP